MSLLNSGIGFGLFKREANHKTYVDKTLMIDTVYRYSQEINPYIAVTRPRRFGKSTAANMIAAFFDESTASESRKLFENLQIGQLKTVQETEGANDPDLPLCWLSQGRRKVIRINMIDLITEKTESYLDFQNRLCQKLTSDLHVTYPDLIFPEDFPLPDILELTGDSFIFVIDEWDAIFEHSFMTEEKKKDYILFLKALLKDKNYIHFVYMTGVLPIAKYSSGSPLNMFMEFTAFHDEILYPFFGMTEDEIREMMNRRGFISPSLEDLAFWYDGYIWSSKGVHMYNPNSVSKALAEGICSSHWTGTGPMNEVRDILRNNIQDLRDIVLRMTGGETIDIELSGFSVEKTQVSTRDEILSAMVVYGFLTYHDRQLKIPNHELMLKFREALASEPLGLHQTLAESKKLLEATRNRRDREVASLIEELHDEKIPFFQYNDENSLACVVVTGYLAALDVYRIVREDKAGKGYVDFSFIPMSAGDMPIILELKYNRSAKNAIKCIHERGYIQQFKGCRDILLVGINYSEKTKKHTCLTELVHQDVSR